MVDFVAGYIDELRSRATERRAEGLTQAAQQYELVADELEARRNAHLLADLTIAEAATESGYSADNLRLMLREGKVPNAGKAGAPRIRRADLPRKPGYGVDVAPLLSGSESPTRRRSERAAGPHGRGAPSLADLAFQPRAATVRRRARANADAAGGRDT